MTSLALFQVSTVTDSVSVATNQFTPSEQGGVVREPE